MSSAEEQKKVVNIALSISIGTSKFFVLITTVAVGLVVMRAVDPVMIFVFALALMLNHESSKKRQKREKHLVEMGADKDKVAVDRSFKRTLIMLNACGVAVCVSQYLQLLM